MRPPAENGQRTRTWRWRAVMLAVVAAAAVGVLVPGSLYLARKPIAERLARTWLAQHHVPGTFEVQSIGLTELTGKLRLGPPADPDLTVERLQVDYKLGWSGAGIAVDTQAVHLFRPRLKARIGEGKLDLGPLASLIQGLSQRPGAPPVRAPDVTVDEGLARLITPGGDLIVTGGGAMTGGVLTRADGELAPFSLTLNSARLAGAAQTIRLARQGNRLSVSMEGGALSLASAGQTWRSAGQTVSADLPAPGQDGRIEGAARFSIDARGLGGDAAGAARVDGGDLVATLSGTVETDAGRASFLGASGQGQVAVQTVRARDVLLSGVVARLAVDRAQWADGHVSAGVRAAISAQGAMDEVAARRLAAGLPVLSAAPAYRTATQAALRAFRLTAAGLAATISNSRWRLALTAPARLASRSGAQLTIAAADATFAGDGASGTSGRLSLNGGGMPRAEVQLGRWTARPEGLQADLALGAQLDLPQVQGLDLHGRGRLDVAGGEARVELADCAAVSARRLPLGDNPALDVAGRVCPDEAPLAQADARGWRVRGRIEAVRAVLPTLGADLTGGEAGFSAESVGAASPSLALTGVGVSVADTSPAPRFKPAMAKGRLELRRGVWTGEFAAATPAGRPIGDLRLTHDDATGSGRVDIDASGLAFAPEGLQPSDLTPLAGFARNADGPVAFTGWFAWGPDRPLTSGGELVARKLTFRSPAGQVLALDADLRLTSLAPLESAKGQRVTVREVETSIPLTGLAATLEFNDATATIEAASAGFSGGQLRLEPMTAPFAPDSTYRGVLVLDHVNLGQVLAASNLSQVMTLQAVVDGRIPFEIGPAGVRIVSGRLAAVGPGRLSISRAALGGVAASQVTAKGAPVQTDASGGLARDLAYDAMENLAFDTLDASLDSVANDRLRILFHIRGRHDPPTAVRARIALGDLIAGKAFSKPIPLPSGTRINLTLDSSLNFGELVRGLEQAWREGAETPRSAAVHDEPAQIPRTTETTRP